MESDHDGTHGASGLVRGPESGPVEAMKTGAVVERDRPRPRTRQVCGIDSRRGVVKRGIHSGRPATVASGADVGNR